MTDEKAGRAAATAGGVVLFGLSWFWMFESYRTIEEEFSVVDTWVICSIVLAVLIVQIGVVAAASRMTGSSRPAALLSAGFIVANAFSLNLVMNATFMTLSPLVMAASLLGGGVVAWTVVRMAAESRLLRRLVFTVLGVLVVIAAAQAIRDGGTAGPQPSEGAQSPEWPSRVVRPVSFTIKPNVYFIGFESMAPQAVLSKYLKYDDSPLLEAIRRNEFRVFRNLFAEQVPTSSAITSLLALDRGTFEDAAARKYPLMSGRMPSPLLELFRRNGYETSTLYQTGYFGGSAGPYVDHYLVNEAVSICSMMSKREIRYAFFGACRLYEGTGWKRVGVPGKSIDFLMHALERIVKRKPPQFLLAHHGPPQHTPLVFSGSAQDTAAFRERYRKLSEDAARNLERILRFLRQNDPSAILFVFGDHGVWLSRRVTWREDIEFYVQDRYAVAGGVYPAQACAASFDAPFNREFVTVPQVARMLIRCLAGGVDPFERSYEHALVFDGRRHRYEDVLYE